MLAIELTKAAQKALQSVPPKHARQLAEKLMALRSDPEPHDSAMMKGSALPYRRVDVGEYRIIYRVEGEAVLVALIGPRNDDAVYRAFKRLQT
ncbi:MAG TPA: type II toxin-antitoxin system RelE/ParE family toxin [Microvirga sp.]|jgi:mRNA interferase RelE/StbE|nr:type II toxin-antitoxin system RelE/ParE family toxin [Microvirga sp.]